MKPIISKIFLALILLSACSGRKLSQPELEQYAADPANGLIQTTQVRTLELSVSYKPAGLFVAQEMEGKTDTSGAAKLLQKYSAAHYFMLHVSEEGGEALDNTGSFNQFSELLQTFSFGMGDKITLITSAGDTLVLGDYAFQRTYGMALGNAVLFAFPKDRLKQYEWLEFTVREFGLGTGTQRFRFREEDLSNIPAIDLATL